MSFQRRQKEVEAMDRKLRESNLKVDRALYAEQARVSKQYRKVKESQVHKHQGPSHIHPSGFVTRFQRGLGGARRSFQEEQTRDRTSRNRRLHMVQTHPKGCNCQYCCACRASGVANPLRSDASRVANMARSRREAILRGRPR